MDLDGDLSRVTAETSSERRPAQQAVVRVGLAAGRSGVDRRHRSERTGAAAPSFDPQSDLRTAPDRDPGTDDHLAAMLRLRGDHLQSSSTTEAEAGFSVGVPLFGGALVFSSLLVAGWTAWVRRRVGHFCPTGKPMQAIPARPATKRPITSKPLESRASRGQDLPPWLAG